MAPQPTRIHVIAGGPCSGKTSLLEALALAGHRVEVETAERVLQAGVKAGTPAAELRADPVAWQLEMLAQDHALFDGLPVDEVVFSDTSFVETLVFAARAGISVGPKVVSWLTHRRYRQVFFLEPLPQYAQSAVRTESRAVAEQISAEVKACYERFGYELISVPSGTVDERAAFVLAFLEAH